MSYIKSCNKCGSRISLRQMPHGQWVAFEPYGETPHSCYKPEKILKPANQKNSKKIKTIIEKEVSNKSNYENTLKKIIKDHDAMKVAYRNAILSKNIIRISYTREDNDFNVREICPIKIIENDYSSYFEAYCNLRKQNRVFKLDRVQDMIVLDKNFHENYKSSGDAFIRKEKKFIDENLEEISTEIDQEEIINKVNEIKITKEENKKLPTEIVVTISIAAIILMFIFL